MKIKIASDEYLEKAKHLSEEEMEKLQFRMRGKLFRRAEDQKLTMTEAIAIQLEIEDMELQEWRKKRQEMLASDKGDKKK
ncbi:MAG TPA: hypothetical protein DCO68_08370 [Methylophilaceae bacterium]|nr:hypothetical protein [Methylophilaceae bacterium]HAJ72081.1 hypothetical protein [Methylophilaceae bacterium]